MGFIDVSLFGSFQRGMRVSSESPRKAIWNNLEHLGTAELLADQSAKIPEADWAEIQRYAGIRICQAVEFRDAARVASPLTAPVSSYYMMLNLVRALYSVLAEKMPTKGHGLTFVPSAGLFDCAATFRGGTFGDYLGAMGVAAPSGQVSLRECFRKIIEIYRDVAAATILKPTHVAGVDLEIWQNGKVAGTFEGPCVGDLRTATEWQEAFPHLADILDVSDGVGRIATQLHAPEKGTDFAAEFCGDRFETDLRSLTHARWYTLRAAGGDPNLPRAAYYLAAMFILSSVSRYEPGIMESSILPTSESGWLIRLFLDAADRYFPQLMLSWAYKMPVLAGGA